MSGSSVFLLTVFTIGFLMFAFVQKISYDRLKEVSLKYYETANERISTLEKRIETRDLKIDSLNTAIKDLKAKK